MPNANWSNPTLTSTYTNFVAEVKNRDEDLALQFDGTTSTNIPTNAIRWDSAANRWKKWNGSSWVELTGTYALTALTTTGSVGIGTSSPGARLQVNAPSTGRSYSSSVLDFSNIHLDGITATTTTSALTFSSGGGGGAAIAFSRGTGFATDIGFWTCSTASANSATERLRIDSSGRLGIGTTDMYGTLNVQRNTSAQYSTISLGDFATATNSVGIYGRVTSSGIFGISSAGAPIVFYNTGSGTGEAARIDSSGRFLVGASATQAGNGGSDLLQVTGAINVVSSTNIYSRLLSTASGLEIIANAYPANLGSTQFIIFKSGTSGGGGPSEIARFTSDGMLGIGTTSPTTLLDVNADTVRVRTARTPASASATGATGEICWDASYIYVCTATNTWRRSAISSW